MDGLKKAVGNFNHWHEHAEILIDLETERIWTINYVSQSDYVPQNKDSVFCLYHKNNIWHNYKKISMKQLKYLVEILIDKRNKGLSYDEIDEFKLGHWENVIHEMELGEMLSTI